MRRGRIVDLQKQTFSTCTMVQGVTKDKQPKYDNSRRFTGGNGTYMHNFRTETYYMMKVVVYEDEQNPKTTVTTDVTDLIREENPSWVRITPQRLNKLKNKVVGEKIDLTLDSDNVIGFDSTILAVEE